MKPRVAQSVGRPVATLQTYLVRVVWANWKQVILLQNKAGGIKQTTACLYLKF